MTERSAEKRAARSHADENGVSYRVALQAVRTARAEHVADLLERLLIEAVEGCGIRHWARVDHWDGRRSVTIMDIGGEGYLLAEESLAPVLLRQVDAGVISEPLDIDSYLADEIVQTALFGCVIYRSLVRRRPVLVA